MASPASGNQTAAEIVLPPTSHDGISRGVATLARLVGSTLGPAGGAVLNGGPVGTERLTDAGIIARRMLALPDRVEDVGAMLLRHAIFRQHETYADGGATVAVLVHALVQEADRALAAGANPMRLRRGIEAASAVVVDALARQAVPAQGATALAGVARSVSGDEDVAKRLAEMFDLMGADAAVDVEEYVATYTDHEFLDGGRWRARPAARNFLPAGKAEAVLDDPLILVANQDLTTVGDVAGVLTLATTGPQRRPLLIIAPAVKEQALNTLILNHERGALTVAAAICTYVNPRLTHELEDLAVVTGGAVAATLLGRPPGRVPAAALGSARRVILGRDSLTIIGGKGTPAAKAERIHRLRAELRGLARTDKTHERLRLRLARLRGGAGILKIGANTETERKARVEAAKKAVRVLEDVVAEGLVPGGGVAFLNCRCAVGRLDLPSAEEAWGRQIVAAALTAPFRHIVCNRGVVDAAVALLRAEACGPDHGYDALANDIVHMPTAGIMDSLSVVRGAWTTAVSAALMAITTDVVVLHAEGRLEAQMRP